MEKIREILSGIGLSEKEVRVFLSLLKRGSGTVGKLALDSGVTRTHIYEILENLEKQGLVTQANTAGVRRYEAIGHAALLANLGRRQQHLQKLEKSLAAAATDFQALQVGSKQKTKVRFFDGPEGIHSIYAEIKSDLKKQKEPSELLTIFSPGLVERTLPGWFAAEEYIEVPKIMSKRGILFDSETARQYLQKIKGSPAAHSYKLWPKERGEFPVDTLCWLNKLTLIDLVDYPSGIIIENSAIVKVFAMWFALMWESLPVVPTQ